MAKHIMARRTAATESYKQIAEIASQNGFNRVVEHLNSQSNQRDSSYLWELDREKGEWQQSESRIRQLISEPCSELLHYTDNSTRAIINGAQLTGSQSLIQDGRNSAVQKHYKVAEQRLIKSQGKANEALLSIDGYTTNSKGSLLNRSRVTRRFELKEVVGTENDYAVMAAKHLQLRNSTIIGMEAFCGFDNKQQAHNNRFRSGNHCSLSYLEAAPAHTDGIQETEFGQSEIRPFRLVCLMVNSLHKTIIPIDQGHVSGTSTVTPAKAPVAAVSA